MRSIASPYAIAKRPGMLGSSPGAADIGVVSGCQESLLVELLKVWASSSGKSRCVVRKLEAVMVPAEKDPELWQSDPEKPDNTEELSA